MGEWTAISPSWWKGEEGKQERKWEAGQMTDQLYKHKDTRVAVKPKQWRGYPEVHSSILFGMLLVLYGGQLRV